MQRYALFARQTPRELRLVKINFSCLLCLLSHYFILLVHITFIFFSSWASRLFRFSSFFLSEISLLTSFGSFPHCFSVLLFLFLCVWSRMHISCSALLQLLSNFRSTGLFATWICSCEWPGTRLPSIFYQGPHNKDLIPFWKGTLYIKGHTYIPSWKSLNNFAALAFLQQNRWAFSWEPWGSHTSLPTHAWALPCTHYLPICVHVYLRKRLQIPEGSQTSHTTEKSSPRVCCFTFATFPLCQNVSV